MGKGRPKKERRAAQAKLDRAQLVWTGFVAVGVAVAAIYYTLTPSPSRGIMEDTPIADQKLGPAQIHFDSQETRAPAALAPRVQKR